MAKLVPILSGLLSQDMEEEDDWLTHLIGTITYPQAQGLNLGFRYYRDLVLYVDRKFFFSLFVVEIVQNRFPFVGLECGRISFQYLFQAKQCSCLGSSNKIFLIVISEFQEPKGSSF
jgi:hypothetical protein